MDMWLGIHYIFSKIGNGQNQFKTDFQMVISKMKIILHLVPNLNQQTQVMTVLSSIIHYSHCTAILIYILAM